MVTYPPLRPLSLPLSISLSKLKDSLCADLPSHLPGSQNARLQEKQLKAQRELFVGNLAPGVVNEQSLYQVFHSALVAAFPQAAQPGQEPVMRVRKFRNMSLAENTCHVVLIQTAFCLFFAALDSLDKNLA